MKTTYITLKECFKSIFYMRIIIMWNIRFVPKVNLLTKIANYGIIKKIQKDLMDIYNYISNTLCKEVGE